MNAKILNHSLVEFFATPRLAAAFRNALQPKPSWARCAAVHELNQGIPRQDLKGGQNGLPKIALSHAEDQLFTAKNLVQDSLVAGAFHLLFMESATHPDQIAQWMRRTNIRAEDRVHIFRVESLESLQFSELLGRVCSAFRPGSERSVIVDAYCGGDTFFVRGAHHRMLHVPLASLPPLRGQPRAVLQNFRIDPDGSFLHWPDLDVHLGWNQFLLAVDPEVRHKAQQRSANFNRRYGAGIRTAREKAGILQAEVEGITERQLRRIEQGECRATLKALTSLAKAHDLDVNTYMDKLAKAIS